MLDGVLEASQVEYKPFGKPPPTERRRGQQIRCRDAQSDLGKRERSSATSNFVLMAAIMVPARPTETRASRSTAPA